MNEKKYEIYDHDEFVNSELFDEIKTVRKDYANNDEFLVIVTNILQYYWETEELSSDYFVHAYIHVQMLVGIDRL